MAPQGSDKPDDLPAGGKPPALTPTLRPERKTAKLSGKRRPRPRATLTAERTGTAAADAASDASTRIVVDGVLAERPPLVGVSVADLEPLLLLPLRLEYRVVTKEWPPVVVDFASELETFRSIDARRAGRSRRAEEARQQERRAAASALMKKSPTVRPAVVAGARELWFRWYPDEGFTRKGIARPSDAEVTAMNVYLGALGSSPWYAPTGSDARAAWQGFANAVGPYRAVHLLRSRTEAAAAQYEQAIGRIAMLPGKVTLFAVKGATLTALGSGTAIPANTSGARSAVSYTPEAIQPGGWLRDFAVAEAAGMGVRIATPAMVEKALDADHVIAVGRFGGDARTEFSDLLKDGVSAGAFSFLRQDTPTNNAPGAVSGLIDPYKNLPGFLAAATQAEAGAFTSVTDTAADLVAQAFSIDAAVARSAINGADTPFADARAMLRVIGPAILDGALDGTTVIDSVDENEFIDALAAACCARGALSAVRLGNNPFGVLPIAPVHDLTIDEADQKLASVQNFLKAYAAFARDSLPAYAEAVVPVFAPDDADAAGKLGRILKANRISRRIDVADVGSAETAPIGCPYIRGGRAQDDPSVYLPMLQTTAFASLPDPTDDDTETPLLYRLARLTLTRNIIVPVVSSLSPAVMRRGRGLFDAIDQDATLTQRIESTGVLARSARDLAGVSRVPGLDRTGIAALKRLNANFLGALQQLERIAARPQGIAELETLLVEVIDLLQHRVDALATGLAYARLVKQRKAGVVGLQAGYFGFLGKLRPASTTGASDGYIQAPSMGQATTAAILRSAYLRHKADGAFEIDLSSRRVRGALALLDVLKKGLPLEEALGLRGERWLHDNRLSRLTFDLRRVFPFVNVTPPESRTGNVEPQPAGIRVFDGLKFIDGALDTFPAGDHPQLARLKGALGESLDALTDVIVAEATHRRALGQAEAAKAWLNVLSGSPVPGEPLFLRTQRLGQGSTYRVAVLAKPANALSDASPREIAEPTLAALASSLLPDFPTFSVSVTLARVDDASRRHSFVIALRNDLDLRPIDIVIGGASELQVRIKSYVIEEWLTDAVVSTDLGISAPQGLNAFVNAALTITVGPSPATPALAQMLSSADSLRAMVQNGRMLEPGDLNAAAAPSAALTEPREMTMVGAAIATLRTRVLSLRDALDGAAAALDSARVAFLADAREARRRLDIDPKDPGMPAIIAAAEQHRRALHTALVGAAAYNEPAALRPFSVEDAIANADALDETIAGLLARMRGRSTTLTAAYTASATAPQRLEQARANRRTLIAALQSALDGEALTILAPVPKVAETTPLLAAASTPAAALGPWMAVRSATTRAVAVTSALTGVQAFSVDAAATEDDAAPADKDIRSAADAPRAQYFGTFLARDEAISATSFAGIVCDEWAEQRPSRIQPAAMAVNYDSPQSEPPHCLLLCVSPNNAQRSWSDTDAAAMVLEAIQWMKIRAMSTDDKPWPAALLPRGNQVAFKAGTRRIPRRLFRLVDLGFTSAESEFVVARDFAPGDALGANSTDIGEITGFRRIKE